jgi:hypothetical protein
VRAAVHDVHHGNRQDFGVRAAEVLVERLAERGGGGVRGGEETPRMALAPSFDLVLVPSSLSMARSMPVWSQASCR